MQKHYSHKLETIDNQNLDRDFIIKIDIPEFTCLCPLTRQPDFATLHIKYIADKYCVELKSLKMYVWSFRDDGISHEAVSNKILDDLVAVIKPRFICIRAVFNVRGGIYTTVIVKYRQPNWLPK